MLSCIILFGFGLYVPAYAKGKPAECCLFSWSEDSSGSVPVEIADFGGQSLNNRKIAVWCQAKINPGYSITVEHSRNGSDFNAIGTFPNSEEMTHFSLVDERPVHNTNYYRLKITDARGRTNYSKLMVVQLYRTSTLSLVSVTPSPTLNDIHINVQLKDRAFVSMKIKDESGQELMKKRIQGVEGLNQYQLEGSGKMSPGNYFLEIVVNNTETLIVPLIKS